MMFPGEHPLFYWRNIAILGARDDYCMFYLIYLTCILCVVCAWLLTFIWMCLHTKLWCSNTSVFKKNLLFSRKTSYFIVAIPYFVFLMSSHTHWLVPPAEPYLMICGSLRQISCYFVLLVILRCIMISLAVWSYYVYWNRHLLFLFSVIDVLRMVILHPDGSSVLKHANDENGNLTDSLKHLTISRFLEYAFRL